MNRDVFLTFDLDWADDEVLREVLDELEAYDCAATFFVTHDSPLVRALGDHPRHERGLHPNFLPLLRRSAEADPGPMLAELRRVAPEAVSVRSHALVHATPLSRAFAEAGLRIDSNPHIPFEAVRNVRPWRFWTGMRVVPFFWSDYIDFLRGPRREPMPLLGRDDLPRVLAFHPIHVYINASSVEDYERLKAGGVSAGAYRRSRPRPERGVGDVLRDVLEDIRARGLRTRRLRDLLDDADTDNDRPS